MRTLGVLITTVAVVLAVPSSAAAAIVPTVPLATAGNYSVLGAETVTNTGPSTLNASLGVSPGTSVTGFPPGIVSAPGATDVTNAAAAQAQIDLTAAYNNAAGRSLDATTTADLSGLVLQGGVYAGPSAGALALNGTLTLDAAGDPTTVFIFTTDSTLITGSSSVVSLINGAQACNVFWRVGSSATLGSGSTFVGTIMANVSISLNDSVTVEGRALARTGAVTLINDTFVAPRCNLSAPTTTTAAVGAASTVLGVTATTVTRATTNSTLPPSGAASTAKGILIGIVLGAVGVGAGVLSRRRPVPTR